MIKLHVEDAAAVSLAVDMPSAVPMTVADTLIPLAVDSSSAIPMTVEDIIIPLSVDSPSAVKMNIQETFVEYDAPEYTGAYRVTPSSSEQTLPTAGKLMLHDVTVDPAQGSRLMTNQSAEPSTSPVVVMPDEGYDGMAKVTVAAMPHGEIDPASLSYDTYLLRGRITAQANVTQAGYVPTGANMAMEYCDELLPTENPKTVTPTTSEQVAVAQNKWTKGQIKVAPIPYAEYDNEQGGITVVIG